MAALRGLRPGTLRADSNFGGMNDDGGGGMSMSMSMTFSTALPFQILFPSWNVATPSDYAVAWLLSMASGTMRHVLARLRHELVQGNRSGCAAACSGGSSRSPAAPAASVNGAGSEGAAMPLLAIASSKPSTASSCGWARVRRAVTSPYLTRSPRALRAVEAFLYAAYVTLGFLNMLITMCYNPGILMAVVAGEVVGMLVAEPAGGLSAKKGLTPSRDTDGGCH